MADRFRALVMIAAGWVLACESVRAEPVAAGAADGRAPAHYPVDESAPKDFFDDRLLRTLNREAAAVVVCRLLDLVDTFPERREPDTFYDASCEVSDVIRGRTGRGVVHFIWQVERGSRMPPPGAELLAYLKARPVPLDAPPPVRWVALDTGVLRYTASLRAKVHPKKRTGR
jgi:hypothetical protein